MPRWEKWRKWDMDFISRDDRRVMLTEMWEEGIKNTKDDLKINRKIPHP